MDTLSKGEFRVYVPSQLEVHRIWFPVGNVTKYLA